MSQQERLMTRVEAAEFLGVPPKTLASWAYRREGPPFYKVGRHARYNVEQLERWLETKRVETSA